jgi:hypothetical protein
MALGIAAAGVEINNQRAAGCQSLANAAGSIVGTVSPSSPSTRG